MAQYGAYKQRSWDGVRAALAADHLLEGAGNDEECARLLSVSTKESGAWLRALPVSTGPEEGLMTAHIPSRLEPTGLMRSDGKRPDGATMSPWKSGCILVWDGTCSCAG